MRSASLLCLLLSGAALVAPAAHAQPAATGGTAAEAPSSPAAAARKAAVRGLADFVLRKQSREGASTAGLALDVASLDELSALRVDYGFEVNTVEPGDLLQGRGELRDMIHPTGVWRFVVRNGARPVGLVTVHARDDGRWEAVSFGGAQLARELDAQMAAHADAARSNVRFVRIFQARSDLLEVVSPVDGKAGYVPLAAARAALPIGAQAAAPTDASALMAPLRAAVAAGLTAGQ